jgi:hypothetical protein
VLLSNTVFQNSSGHTILRGAFGFANAPLRLVVSPHPVGARLPTASRGAPNSRLSSIINPPTDVGAFGTLQVAR